MSRLVANERGLRVRLANALLHIAEKGDPSPHVLETLTKTIETMSQEGEFAKLEGRITGMETKLREHLNEAALSKTGLMRR